MITMEYVPYLASGAIALAVLVLVSSIVGMASGRGGGVSHVKSRLLEREEREQAPDLGQRLGNLIRDLAAFVGSRIGPKDDERISRERQKMLQAGYPQQSAPMVYQGVKAGLALTMPLGVFIVRLVRPETPVPMLLMCGAFLALAGSYLPDMWLRSRAAERQGKIENELPDALDLLVVCVESGMGLDQAITRVADELRESGPNISQEFHQLTLELRAGRRRHEALREMSMRIGLEDLNSLVTLLIQADVFGISVARTLRVYSDTLRTKRFQRAEEKAAKLPAKLLLPLVMCILPALLVIIMGPAVIQLMNVFSPK